VSQTASLVPSTSSASITSQPISYTTSIAPIASTILPSLVTGTDVPTISPSFTQQFQEKQKKSTSQLSELPKVFIILASIVSAMAFGYIFYRYYYQQRLSKTVYGTADLRKWIQEDGGGEVKVARWVSMRMNEDFQFDAENPMGLSLKESLHHIPDTRPNSLIRDSSQSMIGMTRVDSPYNSSGVGPSSIMLNSSRSVPPSTSRASSVEEASKRIREPSRSDSTQESS
jgi:hypothetical protein